MTAEPQQVEQWAISQLREALYDLDYFVRSNDCGCCLSHEAWPKIRERVANILNSTQEMV